MRSLAAVFGSLLVVLAAHPAAAQTLAQATSGAARAGTAAAVRGDVQLAAIPGVRPVAKIAASGDPIFLGDQVTTGPEGRLQIMLLDETVFTIGPNAALVIDQFVFDPSTGAGKVAASVLKGSFRFVTGKVAKREPSDMEVKLPVGSIGVRGTSVAGETDGTRATVVLLGPGPETNTGDRVGRILVTGIGAAGQATTVEIVRPGFGTEIAGANIPPTPAVRIDPARISAITSPLAGTGPRPAAPQQQQQGQSQGAQPAPQGQAQPGQPAAQPGQPGTAPGPQPSGAAAQAGPAAGGTGFIRQQSGQSLAGGFGGIGNLRALAPALQLAAAQLNQAAQTPPPLGPETTFEQLRSIKSGSATFVSQTFALTGSGTGSYTVNYSYNFATATATGSIQITESSGFTSGNGTSGSFALLASPFANGNGPVKLQESGTVGGAGGTITVDYQFGNVGNVVFKTLGTKVTYADGVTGTGQGVLSR